MNEDYAWLRTEYTHPYPRVFMTVSGAHLYGFPSPDSDFDLRGAHRLPLDCLVGLDRTDETVSATEIRNGREIDLVTHDLGKFCLMLLKPNGYVLEQLFSPLVVETSPEHDELKALASRCLTQHHGKHYLGFAAGQWKLLNSENPRRVKPLLYVYRVLLTGIHLMRGGGVEANLRRLSDGFKLPYLDELMARKIAGAERGTMDDGDLAFHQQEYNRLLALLEEKYRSSVLPESHAMRPAMNDFLVRVRTMSVPAPSRQSRQGVAP